MHQVQKNWIISSSIVTATLTSKPFLKSNETSNYGDSIVREKVTMAEKCKMY